MGKSSVFLGTLFLAAVLLGSMAMAATLTLRPNGQGAYSSWTNTGCGSGTSEWQYVDENTTNTTDNLYTSSKSVSESFTFTDTGFTTQTINSVTLYFYGQYYSSTRYQFQPLIRQSSTDYLGSVKSLTSSYATYSQTYATNPATGSAWTIAQVNALEAGMKSYSASYGGRIAQVYAVVDYNNADSCADTDGGNYINTFGTTSGYLGGSAYSHSDYCVDANNVMEYYCSGTTEQSSQQSCSPGYTCSSGRCTYSNTCSDTDGGFVITLAGTTSGYVWGTPYSLSDSCLDATTLNEYYCSGGFAYMNNVTCTGNYTGCSAGACY